MFVKFLNSSGNIVLNELNSNSKIVVLFNDANSLGIDPLSLLEDTSLQETIRKILSLLTTGMYEQSY
jgi:hypothetical protein